MTCRIFYCQTELILQTNAVSRLIKFMSAQTEEKINLKIFLYEKKDFVEKYVLDKWAVRQTILHD